MGAVTKKPPNIPVFLIYAGIIHAIGLALLLPIMITLPGPGSGTESEPSVIDIEVVPATSAADIVGYADEETAALPAAAHESVADETDANEPEAAGAEAVTESRPDETESGDDPDSEPGLEAVPPDGGETAAKARAELDADKPVKAKARASARKTVSRGKRSRSAAGKGKPKIAPFNGALSGLFAPGAPAQKRR